MANSSTQTRYRVSGMDCASCASKIDTAVRRMDGVEDVSVSVTNGSLTVTHADSLGSDAIARQVSRLGYGATPWDRGDGKAGNGTDDRSSSHDDDAGAAGQAWWRSGRARLTIASAAALVVAYGIGLVYPAAEHWPFLAALLVGLVPIARRALSAALAGTPFSIETLMTIAAVGAVLIGATEEAAMVVLLFLVGELLEGVAAGRARASIQGLADLVPKTALVERNGGTAEVPAATLAVGDVIVVRPGDRIPADGEIVEGSSDIDESPVTGESTPKRKGEKDVVFAGTISTDGVLKIRVTATAEDNTIARVVRLVE